jgi:hypothetical protein
MTTVTAQPEPLHMSCGCIWEGKRHERRTRTCPCHAKKNR